MERKKISKQQWQDFIAKNCDDSYSLVVSLCILEIFEHGAKTKEQMDDCLHQIGYGISGAQADFAIGYALKNEPDGWLDKDMVGVSKQY